MKSNGPFFTLVLEFDESGGEGFAQADSGVSKTLEVLRGHHRR